MSELTEADAWRTIEHYDPFHVGIYGGGTALNFILASAGIAPQPTEDIDGYFPQAMAAPWQDLPGVWLRREPGYPEFTISIPGRPELGLAPFDATGNDDLYWWRMGQADRLHTVFSPAGRLLKCLPLVEVYFHMLRGKQNLTKTEQTVETASRAGLLDDGDAKLVLDEYFRLLEVKVYNSRDRMAAARREDGLAQRS